MKKTNKVILIIISMIGLGLTVIPSFFVFAKVISLSTHKQLMFVGTVLWFVTAPFWIGKKTKNKELSAEGEP